MNKIKLLLISIAILFLLLIASWFKLFGLFGSSQKIPANSPTPSPTEVISQKASVSIIFDNGKEVNYSTYNLENLTAFGILKEAADSNKMTLKTKQYSFGVFVQSIDNNVSSNKKAWIYFVNGEAGTIAADQYKLKPGDKVEWKYIAPSGE